MYSNNCERPLGSAWNSIKTLKVSCGFNGYVNKIVVGEENYSNTQCADEPFMTNTYTYGLKKAEDATDPSRKCRPQMTSRQCQIHRDA